jgi:serine/threonine protein phosphatase 1
VNNPTREIAVIGDIHGDADRLARALMHFRSEPTRHLILTGDYINRGPDTHRVLEMLISVREQHPAGVTLLRGNHEDALLNYLNGGSISNFAAHGGMATITSYRNVIDSESPEAFQKNFPEPHKALVEGLATAYEDDNVLVSHTGFNPFDPEDRSHSALCSRGHPALFRYSGPWPRPLTVCGHYVQKGGRPYVTPHLVCLDTGAGTVPDAPLTALLLPERIFMQF